MPQSHYLGPISAIALIPLVFAYPSCADGSRLMAIGGEAGDRFLPLTRQVDGKYLPNHVVRYLPLPPRRGAVAVALPITNAPAKRQIAGSSAPPTHVIRHDAPVRAVHAVAAPTTGRPVVEAALIRQGDQLGPLDHIWPIDPGADSRVTSDYGWRADPFTGAKQFHGAIDIAAPAGTAVLATAPARVHAVGEHPRLGHYVMLRYADGSRSTYGHLKDYRVGTGQLVARGEIIATVGSSGRSTGPHVDFRLDVKGQRIDPLPLLHRRITVAQN